MGGQHGDGAGLRAAVPVLPGRAQQLRWVAAGAAAAVTGLLAGAAAPQNSVFSSILYAAVLCIPLGVAVAVLRYRLWDLDRLVSRTVTYAVVTACWPSPTS